MLLAHLIEAVLSHCTVQELHITRQNTPTFKMAAERILQARFPQLTLPSILKHTVPKSLLQVEVGTSSVKHYNTRLDYNIIYVRQQQTESALSLLPLIKCVQIQVYSTYHNCPILFIQRPHDCDYLHMPLLGIFIALLYDLAAQNTNNEIIWCNLRDPNAITVHNFTVKLPVARYLSINGGHFAPMGRALVTDSSVLYCDGTLVPLDIQPGTRLVWKNGALYGDDTILHVLH